MSQYFPPQKMHRLSFSASRPQNPQTGISSSRMRTWGVIFPSRVLVCRFCVSLVCFGRSCRLRLGGLRLSSGGRMCCLPWSSSRRLAFVSAFWAVQSVVVAVGVVFHDAVYGTFEGVEGERVLPSGSLSMAQVGACADLQ